MHLVELIEDITERPHLPSLCIQRLGPHSSDGPLLIYLLLYSIPQAQKLHHSEDKVLVLGELRWVTSKGVRWRLNGTNGACF